MPLSRLSVRLTAGFAIAFAVGLGVLAAGALGYLWRESGRRIEARLTALTRQVNQSLQRELGDAPDSSLAYAADEVVSEWPSNNDSFAIVDEAGRVVAIADRAHAGDSLSAALARAGGGSRFAFTHAGEPFRAVVTPATTFRDGAHAWTSRVIAFRFAEGIEGDAELLAGTIAVAFPLIIVLSLLPGYVLARRALKPMNELRHAIAAMAPDDLAQRLPVRAPTDEIGALAAEFNALLGRLDAAQRRNRRFVREAAHQIRTPLTLVLGEAGNELTAAPAADRAHEALARIRLAAEQMRRRVDELFLLAEAQAGASFRTEDDVELDDLVLQCTDLMRARATSLGRALAIGRAEEAVVRGNAPLLHEALVELIENACRHGTADAPITVSAVREGDHVALSVESAGPEFDPGLVDDGEVPARLGLPIVEWIARGHGGELQLTRIAGLNRMSMSLSPRRADVDGTPSAQALRKLENTRSDLNSSG